LHLHNKNARPLAIRSNVPGSGTALAVAVKTACPPGAVYALRDPFALPSILKTVRVFAPVGSDVANSGKPVKGSRRENEKASGKELGPGAFVVASTRKEIFVPSVKSVRYSLKKEESVSVMVPGKVPLTPPVGKEAPRIPSVENPDTVTELAGDPPAMKSKASCAVVPLIEELSSVTV
jgi:hypothetical protein